MGFLCLLWFVTQENCGCIPLFLLVTLLLLVFIAISRLFMQVELPSDIAAGYVFGGVWLGLNILLLEILRLLKNIDTKQ